MQYKSGWAAAVVYLWHGRGSWLRTPSVEVRKRSPETSTTRNVPTTMAAFLTSLGSEYHVVVDSAYMAQVGFVPSPNRSA